MCSVIGYQPVFQSQRIRVSATDITVKGITHQIFHALGRNHENNRKDRDNYIIIQPENILSGKIFSLHTEVLFVAQFASDNQHKNFYPR